MTTFKLFRALVVQPVCARSAPLTASCVRYNSQRAAITKTNRAMYARTYPTLMVQPDGSTIRIRHPTPRRVIVMPVDLTSLSAEERQARLAKRKPKQKIIIEDDIEDSFDLNQYSHLWKK